MEYRISHILQLGPFCGTAILGGDYEFNAFYTECGPNNNMLVDFVYPGTGDVVCEVSEPFFLIGGDFVVSITESTTIEMDNFRDGCYTFVGEPTASPTEAPAMPTATISPVSPQVPNVVPTLPTTTTVDAPVAPFAPPTADGIPPAAASTSENGLSESTDTSGAAVESSHEKTRTSAVVLFFVPLFTMFLYNVL